MKRGKILIGIILTLMVILPLKVNAASSLTLTGADKGGPGNNIVYEIGITTDKTAKNIKTELTYDSTVLELVSIINKSWSGSNTTGSSPKTLEFTSNGANGASQVASLTFKVKSSTTKASTSIKLSGTTISVGSDESESIESANEVVKNIKISSTDATLSSLKINNESVKGFRSKTYKYNVIVDSSVDSAIIKANLSSSNASFLDGYGPRSVKLEYGENKAEIRVKAESGDIKTYTITINREDTRTANYYLKDIIINAGSVPIEFDKLVLDYTLKAYKLTTLEIEATPEDEKATVKIDKPKEIIIGDNVVKITVKSENGKEQVYTLTINNSDQEINTKLKNLSVKGQSFEFDPNKLDYSITFDRSMKDGITIYATTASPDAKMEILGNEDLKVGSKIKVRVYADDGSETVYTITLVKDKRVNFFMLLELLIIIVLMVLLAIQINGRKKRKNKSDKEPEKQEETISKESLDDSPTMEMDTTEFKIK